jgi:hypothetical protein
MPTRASSSAPSACSRATLCAFSCATGSTNRPTCIATICSSPRSASLTTCFFNRFVGTTVFHCHILAHEDNGMMGIIDISRSGRLSKATIKSLEEMNKAMSREHSTAGDGAHGGHTAKCHCADAWT